MITLIADFGVLLLDISIYLAEMDKLTLNIGFECHGIPSQCPNENLQKDDPVQA